MACFENNLSGVTANYTFGFDEPIANQPVVVAGVGDVHTGHDQGGGKRRKRKSRSKSRRKSRSKPRRKSRSRTKSRRSRSKSRSRSRSKPRRRSKKTRKRK